MANEGVCCSYSSRGAPSGSASNQMGVCWAVQLHVASGNGKVGRGGGRGGGVLRQQASH